VKALGVIHGHNVNIDALWLEKKIKSCLEVWKTRDLTYHVLFKFSFAPYQSSRNVSVLSDMTSKIWADFAKD
jgi:hypothetical protein